MPDAKNRYAISLISQALRVACVFPCIAGYGAESNRSFKLLIRTRKEAGKSFHLKRDQEEPDAVAVLGIRNIHNFLPEQEVSRRRDVYRISD